MIRSTLARLVVAASLPLLLAPCAEAGRRYYSQPVRSVCHSQYCTTAAIVQPAYHATPFVAATYNFVGAPVRYQAEQAYTMQNHPQWQQFQQYVAQQQAQAMFQQYMAQAQQAGQPPAQSQPPAQLSPAQAADLQQYANTRSALANEWQQPADPWKNQSQAAAPANAQPGQPLPPEAVGAPAGSWQFGPNGWQPNPNWQPPAAPQANAPGPLPPPVPTGPPNVATPNLTPYAAKIPTLIAECSQCHSAEKAPEGFVFDGSIDYTIKGTGPAAEAMQAKRDQIMQAIIQQRMPKNGELAPEAAGQIVAELYGGE